MPALRRGTVSVEAALVIPVLLILVVGVLEWGRVLQSEVAIVQVARDAVLAGARTSQSDDPEAVVQSRLRSALSAAGFDAGAATITVTPGTLGSGATLEVWVSVPYDPSMPLVPVPANLAAGATARLEDQ